VRTGVRPPGIRLAFSVRLGEGDSGGRDLAVDPPKLPQRAVVGKDVLAAAHDDRVDHQPVLIHQPVLHERAHQDGAAEDEQFAAVSAERMGACTAIPCEFPPPCRSFGGIPKAGEGTSPFRVGHRALNFGLRGWCGRSEGP
jgi:hypothetical protein